jgi:hypothetical protein
MNQLATPAASARLASAESCAVSALVDAVHSHSKAMRVANQ